MEIKKKRKPGTTVVLSVGKDTKVMLDVLKKGKLSYSKIIEYLLVKSGHLPSNKCKINYLAIDDFINGEE